MAETTRSNQTPFSSQQELEDFEQDDHPQSFTQNDSDQNQRLMQEKMIEDILDNAYNATDSQKITWHAIYSLKKKEVELNQQLNQEIEKIKQKYELLKQPIYHQISQVSLGRPVAPELYKPQGMQSKIDLKLTKPKKIEDFWGIILDKQGLLIQQVDVDCITKVTQFKCELLNHSTNHLRITFKFGSETNYFSNKTLIAESRYDNDKNKPVREIKYELKYKKAVVEHSLFTLLFDKKTDINHFYNVASELYQDYINPIQYYFREEQEDLENGAIREQDCEDDQQEDEDQDQDEEEQQEESQEEQAPPTKKVKKEIEKPECKNQ